MNQEIKKQWTDALRNHGNRPVQIASLCHGGNLSWDGYLVDLYLKANNKEWEKRSCGVWAADGRTHTMPDGCLTWAGLDDYDPLLPSYNNGDPYAASPVCSRVVVQGFIEHNGNKIPKIDLVMLANYIDENL